MTTPREPRYLHPPRRVGLFLHVPGLPGLLLWPRPLDPLPLTPEEVELVEHPGPGWVGRGIVRRWGPFQVLYSVIVWEGDLPP